MNDAADSSQDLACLYFVGQAVRDWRLARRCGFIKEGGLEVWLRFAGFNVDAETIVAGLETVTAIKPKIGHLLKDEHEQSGNYYVDMEWRTK